MFIIFNLPVNEKDAVIFFQEEDILSSKRTILIQYYIMLPF